MRQITIDAARAFNYNRAFKRSNTQVKIIGNIDRVELLLHGNLIAFKDTKGTFISDGGWQSVTTKERLNGLLSYLNDTSYNSIIQKDFQWYLEGVEWNGVWKKIAPFDDRRSEHERLYG
jgi:hypothetical protein